MRFIFMLVRVCALKRIIHSVGCPFRWCLFSLKVYLVLLPVDWTDKFLTLKLMSFFRVREKKGKNQPISYPLWFKEVILRLVWINWYVFRVLIYFLCSAKKVLHLADRRSNFRKYFMKLRSNNNNNNEKCSTTN